MKLLGVLLTIALLLGGSAFAIQQLGDRELFTPPPDAVAESFVHEVMTRRWDQAQEYLAEPVPQSELEALQSRLGEVQNIESEITSRDDQRASVEVKVKEQTLTIALEWREGEWRVSAQSAPDVLRSPSPSRSS